MSFFLWTLVALVLKFCLASGADNGGICGKMGSDFSYEEGCEGGAVNGAVPGGSRSTTSAKAADCLLLSQSKKGDLTLTYDLQLLPTGKAHWASQPRYGFDGVQAFLYWNDSAGEYRLWDLVQDFAAVRSPIGPAVSYNGSEECLLDNSVVVRLRDSEEVAKITRMELSSFACNYLHHQSKPRVPISSKMIKMKASASLSDCLDGTFRTENVSAIHLDYDKGECYQLVEGETDSGAEHIAGESLFCLLQPVPVSGEFLKDGQSAETVFVAEDARMNPWECENRIAEKHPQHSAAVVTPNGQCFAVTDFNGINMKTDAPKIWIRKRVKEPNHAILF